MRPLTGYPILLGVVAVFGCEAEQDRMRATSTDSAGVVVVMNPQVNWTAWGDWSIGQQPILDLGGVGADSNYQFYRAESSVRLSDGSIVVANAGTGQLRMYDSDGLFLTSAGREGSGPGEFERIAWAARYRHDSIVVFDRRLVRLSVFDSEGHFARTVTPRDAAGRAITNAVGAFGDGTFLVIAEVVTDGLASGVFRPVWNLFRCTPEGEVGDSVGSYLGEESYLHAFRTGGAMDSPRLFGYTTALTVSGDRLYAGDTGDFEVRVHAATGELTAVFRRRFRPRGIDPEDIQLLQEQRLERVSNIPHLRDRLDEFFAAMPLPPTLPVFGSLIVDDADNLWVEEYPRPGDQVRLWTVFGADGTVVAMLRSPERFEPQHIGEDFVLGRWRDEYGEEHVRLHELSKG